MESEYVASRWTRGNFLFPTRLRITDQSVVRRKRSWFSVHEETVNARNIANVNIRTGLIWSDIRIETSGGSDPLDSHGHSKSDAREFQKRVQELQARAGGAPQVAAAAAGDTRACPHCAETIKKAAKVCRFCNRELG
jgi:Bacterial PH domain